MRESNNSIIVVLGLVIVAATVSAGTVNVAAECDGLAMHVSVGILDDHLEPGPDWTGLVIYRRAMESDGEPAALNAGDPLPWSVTDGQYTILEYIDENVEPNRGYQYFARVLDAEGNEYQESSGGGPYSDWAGCGEFAIGRGVLSYELYSAHGVTYAVASFDPPCDGFWAQPGFCPDLPLTDFLAEWFPYLGLTLEIRGHYIEDGMLHECGWATDEILHVEDCSGLVTTWTTSWTSVKQLYR